MTTLQVVKYLALATSLVVAAVPSWAQPAPSDATTAARIDALVRPQAEAERLSGVVLVARGNQILFQDAYGFANWELRVPNSLATRFGIASITKAMTQTVAAVLADAGRLDVAAPVDRYLPGFPNGPGESVPTLRHLLTHRSGVPHRVTSATDETQALHPADIVARVQATGLLFEPGSRRLYSSAGYTCLARVLEIVEGKPFASILAERIFAPADMFSATSATGQRLMARRAMPYLLGADDEAIVVTHAPYKDLRFLSGAGDVYATAEDLLRFVEALRGGVFGAARWSELFGGDPARWDGWTGRTNGYESSVDVLAAENLVFVFLSNLQSAANWQIRERIRTILVRGETTPMAVPPAVAVPFEKPRALLGRYGAANAPAEIGLRDGRLFRGDNQFYPTAGERYYIPVSGTVMRFRRDQTGAVDALITIAADGQETVRPRLTAP